MLLLTRGQDEKRLAMFESPEGSLVQFKNAPLRQEEHISLPLLLVQKASVTQYRIRRHPKF